MEGKSLKQLPHLHSKQEFEDKYHLCMLEDRYLLKLYPKCFVGSDLVDWMVDNLSIPLEKAVKIGQQLVDNKIIHHVHDQHEFENRYLFYRFYIDE